MADKAWEVVKPAVAAAVKEWRESDRWDAEDGNGGGDILADRIEAALRGSDWRYVKKLGGTLEREF